MRQVLIFFFLKYKENWDKIFNALDKLEKISSEELKKIDTKDFITILDKDYPDDLKTQQKPPFVIRKKIH